VLTSADPAVRTGSALGYQVHPTVESWGLGNVSGLCGQILELEPDIVHVQNPTVKYNSWRSLLMSMVIAALKRRKPGLCVVLTQHDIAIGRGLFRRRYGPALRRADAVLVSNQRDYQAVIGQGVDPGKVHLARVSAHFAPPGRSADRRSAARASLNIADDMHCLMYFGYVHPGRNIDTLVRAVGLLRAAGRPVCAVIAGGPYRRAERYYRRCQRLARDLGVADHISWTGFAGEEQVLECLAAADVFVSLPERGADMRNTSIITAILAELPVITTRNRRYYVDADMDGFGCTYVDPHDAAALAEAVRRIAENPPTAEVLRQRAKALAPERIWAGHIDVSMAAYRREPPAQQRTLCGDGAAAVFK